MAGADFGFTRDENGQIVPCDAEQVVLNLINRCQEVGCSWEKISDAIKDTIHPPKHKEDKKNKPKTNG